MKYIDLMGNVISLTRGDALATIKNGKHVVSVVIGPMGENEVLIIDKFDSNFPTISEAIKDGGITVDNYEKLLVFPEPIVINVNTALKVDGYSPVITESGLMCDLYFYGAHLGPNPHLVDNLNLSDSDVANIIRSHCKRYVIEALITEYIDYPYRVKKLLKDWTDNEYHLQELWGFQRDSSFHRFWEIPACECPKLDNEDPLMMSPIFSSGCKLHGDRVVAGSKLSSLTEALNEAINYANGHTDVKEDSDTHFKDSDNKPSWRTV